MVSFLVLKRLEILDSLCQNVLAREIARQTVRQVNVTSCYF